MHLWSHPCCICAKALNRPLKPATICGAVSFMFIMSLTITRSVESLDQISGLSFSSLPITWSTSAICSNMSGSICAAQPVTTISTSGFCLRVFLMDCFTCRTASEVTAQELKTTRDTLLSGGRLASIIFDSNAFRRQPNVSTLLFIILLFVISSKKCS